MVKTLSLLPLAANIGKNRGIPYAVLIPKEGIAKLAHEMIEKWHAFLHTVLRLNQTGVQSMSIDDFIISVFCLVEDELKKILSEKTCDKKPRVQKILLSTSPWERSLVYFPQYIQKKWIY